MTVSLKKNGVSNATETVSAFDAEDLSVRKKHKSNSRILSSWQPFSSWRCLVRIFGFVRLEQNFFNTIGQKETVEYFPHRSHSIMSLVG